MADKRFVYPDSEAIVRLRTKQGWNQADLARSAGVSLDSVKRAERGERMQLGTATRIATALKVQLMEIVENHHQQDVTPKKYSWDDLMAGARKVGEEIFKDGEFLADAVLTFPGPSSLFCGLVLALLPLEVFVRIPVYTAILLDATKRVSVRKKYFNIVTVRPQSQRALPFKILIPRELLDDSTKRVVVIDDAIITGGAMKRLRQLFAKANVKFACCLCYDGRDLPNERLPDIIGLPLDSRKKFPMPWGRDSFCFEEAFLRDAQQETGQPL